MPGIKYVVDAGTARISRYSAAREGAAAADRGDLAGEREPALRPRGPHERRHRDPAVLRGGLREAPRVHRSRDPAHQPRRGHPADDLARPRRHRRRSRSCSRRTRAASRTASTCCASSGRSRRDRQRAAATASPTSAASSPRLPIDPRFARMVVESKQHGVGREVLAIVAGLIDPGPARAPAREAAAGRPAARPVRRPDERLPRAARTSGTTSRRSRRSCRRARSGACARPSSSTTCACASGRTCTGSSPAGEAARADGRRAAASNPDGIHRSLLAGLLSQHRPRATTRGRSAASARSASTSAPGRRAFVDLPRVGAREEAAARRDERRARRDEPPVRPHERGRSTRPGPSRSPATS